MGENNKIIDLASEFDCDWQDNEVRPHVLQFPTSPNMIDDIKQVRDALISMRAFAKSFDCDYQEECNPGTEDPCPSCKHVYIADYALTILDRMEARATFDAKRPTK